MRRVLPILLTFVAAVSTWAADDLLPPMTEGIPAEYAPRRAGALVNADRKISVTNEGLFRITYSNVVAAGITAPVGAELRLFNKTQEVALATSNQGVWGANDYAVFYGVPHDGYWTVTNSYWLGVGGSGLRMGQRNAAPQAGAPVRDTHLETVRYQPNNIFAPTYLPQDNSFDHWFANHIFTTSTNIYVATPHRVPLGTGTVTLSVWGRSADAFVAPDHVTRFVLNGANVQTAAFDGMVQHLATNYIAQNTLSNGLNTIQLRQQSASSNDIASLQWAEVAYWASNRVQNGRLLFSGESSTNNYIVAPWNTNETPWLLDVRQPHAPVRLINYEISGADSSGELKWGDYASGTNRYFVASPTALVNVAISAPVLFQNLADTTRNYDYLIIADGNLTTSAYRLAKYRARDGMRTLMVPIGSVYDEFSYGIKDARAIKQFLGYAFHHWAVSPRYTLLVGDGNYDPRNNLKLANPAADAIPVFLDAAGFEYSVQDNWYGTVNGPDLLTDIQIGRLPFNSPSNVDNAISKIIGFEAASASAAWRKKALLVADSYDGPFNDFKTASESQVKPALLSRGLAVTTSYLQDQGGQTAINRMIVTNAVNAGTWAVNYFGHGAPLEWATGMNDVYVNQLRNTAWPVFTIMTCNNGSFANPTADCMASVLVQRNQRGASATLSASALSIQQAAGHYVEGLYAYFTNAPPRARLGDAIQAGLLELSDYSPGSRELLFYNLFGDPAQVVVP